MKLKEAESLILQQGLTDELLQEYEKALRRSRSDYCRQQNCYVLGYELRLRDYPGALRLVEYAMQRYRFEYLDMVRRGYEMLAHIHRDNGRPDLAKPYLAMARQLLLQERGGEGGDTFLSLRNELNLTRYQWSEELERLYLETDAANELIWTLRANGLLLAMAEYIVAEHRGDAAFMVQARERMAQLLVDAEHTEENRLWERHRVDTSIVLTEEQEGFLRRIGLIE